MDKFIILGIMFYIASALTYIVGNWKDDYSAKAMSAVWMVLAVITILKT